jgi:hypothetical protein
MTEYVVFRNMFGMFRVWFRDHDLQVMIRDLVVDMSV